MPARPISVSRSALNSRKVKQVAIVLFFKLWLLSVFFVLMWQDFSSSRPSQKCQRSIFLFQQRTHHCDVRQGPEFVFKFIVEKKNCKTDEVSGFIRCFFGLFIFFKLSQKRHKKGFYVSFVLDKITRACLKEQTVFLILINVLASQKTSDDFRKHVEVLLHNKSFKNNSKNVCHWMQLQKLRLAF